MEAITIKAPAKINLSLDITGVREDGYHFLKTVMQAVTLFDMVTVARTDAPGIMLSCSRPDIPCDETNIAYKAAAAFFSYMGIQSYSVSIHIKKKIPVQAGLGGGSTDGAAVITALDRLYETHLKPERLQEIGLTVGADIPFCITGGMALAEGIGEILTPIPGRLDAQLVICKPPVGVSTAAAYRKFDEAGAVCPPLTESLVAALIAGDLKGASDCMSNAFEKLLSLPEVDRIERRMQEHGALTAVMSGSGSAVYGIFDSRLKAEKCLLSLKEEYREVFLCEPYPAGCTASKNFFGGETE